MQFRRQRRRQSEPPRRSDVELSVADAATAADSAESLAAHAAEYTIPPAAAWRSRTRPAAAAATASAEAPAPGSWASLTRGRLSGRKINRILIKEQRRHPICHCIGSVSHFQHFNNFDENIALVDFL